MAESVLVTGATGLVGGALVRHFAAEGRRVYAAVRNVEKARALFGGLANVEIAEWDVTKPGGPRSCAAADARERVPPVDWLVHAAAETASRAFVERPVETIASILDGTRNALEFARAAEVKSEGLSDSKPEKTIVSSLEAECRSCSIRDRNREETAKIRMTTIKMIMVRITLSVLSIQRFVIPLIIRSSPLSKLRRSRCFYSPASHL